MENKENTGLKPKRRGIRILFRSLIIVFILAVLFLAFVYWYDSAGQSADTSFDTSVKAPAYVSVHPKLLFDAGHNNFHTAEGRYKPLADLLRNDGYIITENHGAIDKAILDSVNVLLISNAMGPDGHEGSDAFTSDEKNIIADWVKGGGALLLIADHVPFGGAARELSRCFGVEMYFAFARDDNNHEGWDNERLVFSQENGLLADCPVINGRNSSEKVCSVITFTGQSLSVPPGATGILKMDDNAYDWESGTIRNSAKGHAQCVSIVFGKGRVVVLGEAGVLSAQVDPLGFRMGMNYPGSCDRQFALNIMHWLSGLLN